MGMSRTGILRVPDILGMLGTVVPYFFEKSGWFGSVAQPYKTPLK